jgi:hypothetical protein
MTRRAIGRQTTDQEASRLASQYAEYRLKLRGLQPERVSWRTWCGSLALGYHDRVAIRSRIKGLKLEGVK